MIRPSWRSVVASATLAACASPGPTAEEELTRIRVDLGLADAWTVSPLLFGRFFEHNGRDAYPGLFAQHLANGSFERWYGGNGRRTEILYDDVREHEGLAYPWEPRAEGGARVVYGAAADAPHGSRSQRVEVLGSGAGGVAQRVALPDLRAPGFDLSVGVRGEGVEALEATLRTPDGELLARARVPVSAEWTRDTVRLLPDPEAAPRYRDSPFGKYVLVLLARSRRGGHVDLDRALLMSSDAVAGKYNPTTIALLREFGVTSMRWPGGNWASAYHWEDGVGPPERRPVRPNVAWGGLEPNDFGTAEFLEFSAAAGLEPLINVGFNTDIPPEEAARWVQYVNGDASTPMGRLRAAHGHPEPWGVRLWQVGNEVYGDYQIGHTDAGDFARRFLRYRAAMRAVDSTIVVLAAGVDPGYVDWGGNAWNETLLEVAGTAVDGIDVHRYVRAIRVDGNRAGWDPLEYARVAVAFSTQFEDLIRELRQTGEAHGVPGVKVSVGEWNISPDVSPGWPEVDYPNMAHAAAVAGFFNAFIRQGDAVRWSYQRDNTLYFRPYPVDLRPINPGAYTLKLYSEVFTERPWRHLPLSQEGPTFFMPRAGRRIRARPGVPYVDAAAGVSAAGEAVLFLVNRDLRRPRSVEVLPADGWRFLAPAHGLLQAGDDPFSPQDSWGAPVGFRLEELELMPSAEGGLRLALPPASVLRVRVRVKDGT